MIGHQYCSVRAAAAVEAVQLLDAVQVGQAVAVDDHVVGPPHPFDAPDREADGLVDADGEIEEGDGDDEAVDRGRDEQGRERRPPEEGEQPGLQLPVPARDLLFEHRAAFLDVVAEGLALGFQLALDLLLQAHEPPDQVLDLVIHGHGIASRACAGTTVGLSPGAVHECPEGVLDGLAADVAGDEDDLGSMILVGPFG